VAVGEQIRAALVAHEGIPRERIDVIYNGIDLGRFEGDFDRTGIRASLGLSEEDVVVTQVARLVELKDYPTALRAIQQGAAEVPRLRYLIVGDGPERQSIEALIDQLDLQGIVQVLGSRDDVAEILAASDIFLLTSITEGIPLTLIEAMATGLPCVATDVGGVAEVVIEKETGLLAPEQDSTALARHIRRLANEPALRRELGAAGKRRAREKFDERQMQAAFVKLYQEVLATN